MAAAQPFPHPRTVDGRTVVESESTARTLLESLDDPACRRILASTSGDVLTAGEIAERCDLPLSTTYRKLDRLTDAGLLAEGTRIRRSGSHTSEYVRAFDDVVVSLDADAGIELAVGARDFDG